MCGNLYRGVAFIAALSLVTPAPSFAQATPATAQPTPATAEFMASAYNAEQLDALLAPIALYPDTLLVQVLMASTFPLQVVEASRWVGQPGNNSLQGDALAKALEPLNWDPSVKSLVPFPQVLAMMNGKLDWMQQVGYAFATQQGDVMDSVQRLRRQAQAAGTLATNDQQRVVVADSAVVIEPANPQTVYVPVYNPTVVYGTWPYPSYPPVYFPPPPGYVAGNALVAGIAFATGVAVVGSLWGWARPTWYGGGGYGYGRGYVNVNVNRFNTINVNRPPINSGVWRPPAGGVGGRPVRPPGGPVGVPGRPAQLPANAIGRPNVRVPGSAVNRPPAAANRPGGGQPLAGVGQRPGGGGTQRPGAAVNRPPAAGQRPGGAVNRPPAAAQRPGGVNRPPAAAQRPSGAFGGMNDGARAGQYGNRGQQSRNVQQHQQPRAGNPGGGGRGAGQSRPARHGR